jgi:magnesium-transporting ATPase (P-type)
LILARRFVSREEWDILNKNMQEAKQMVGEGRKDAVRLANEALETDLEVIGATGVEDKLQPGVSETLESLAIAGIKVSKFNTEYRDILLTERILRFGC